MVNRLKSVYWGAYGSEMLKKAQEMLAQKYNFTPTAQNNCYIRYNQSSQVTTTFHSSWTLELISRFYNEPIRIISNYIKGPTEAISERYLPACTDLLNTTENHPTFFVIGTAPSVFKSKQVQQWRELNGGYSTVQDSVLCKRSQNFILGMSKIRKTVIIFINNTFTFDTARQVLTFILASKMLPPENTPELSTQNFVKRLTRLCAELTEKALSFGDADTGATFKAFFDEYWENEDAFKIDVTKQISTFLQERNKKELKDLEEEYEHHQREIRTALSTIAAHSTALEKVSEQIEFVKQKINAGTSNEIKEFMEFLDRSKTIKEYSFSNGLLQLTIDSFLYVNDPEQFLVISKNRLKERLDSEEEINAYLNAFKHIVVDEEYKIKTMAFVKLDMLNLVPARDNNETIPDDRIPSPHIMHYNCWGAHSRLIAERVKNRDLMGVIEQIIEACSGLNVYDSPVVSKFFSSLFGRASYKCFVDTKNKQDISLKEIMEVTNETNARVEAGSDN